MDKSAVWAGSGCMAVFPISGSRLISPPGTLQISDFGCRRKSETCTRMLQFGLGDIQKWRQRSRWRGVCQSPTKGSSIELGTYKGEGGFKNPENLGWRHLWLAPKAFKSDRGEISYVWNLDNLAHCLHKGLGPQTVYLALGDRDCMKMQQS